MDFMHITNLVSLLALAIIGFYCAYKMNLSYPLWLRLVVLSPALSSLYKIAEFFQGGDALIASDILQRLSICLIYALVASRFGEKPWLEMRHKKHTNTSTQ